MGGAPSRIGPSSACFNGAAAKSSGKYLRVPARARPRIHASMGPPLKAAENRGASFDRVGRRRASMGPPLKAAENADLAPRKPRFRVALQWGRR